MLEQVDWQDCSLCARQRVRFVPQPCRLSHFHARRLPTTPASTYGMQIR